MDNYRICKLIVGVIFLATLSACTVNPATGQKEFTGLMSQQQEIAVGSQEHSKIIAEYGGAVDDDRLQSYINHIGQNLAKVSERPDLTYHFTVLDSPVVNAFALPGGYIYITRGTLAVANDEDELAAVLGHEIGHVAARHQAARYSQGIVTQLGAGLLDAAVGSSGFSRALNIGTNLYMSSYSREQETQADQLGVRYLSRSGYQPHAMARFLNGMENTIQAEAKSRGKNVDNFNYFSSHPDTGKRVAEAQADAARYPSHSTDTRSRDRYLNEIDGLTYGVAINRQEGFIKGQTFYHPDLGFKITFPHGYDIVNKPDKILAVGPRDEGISIDFAPRAVGQSAAGYLEAMRVAAGSAQQVEQITIGDKEAATAQVNKTVNGQPVSIRLIVVAFAPDHFVRMQIVMPPHLDDETLNALKTATYSFRGLSKADERAMQPMKIHVVKARAGDEISVWARQLPIDAGGEAFLRALNGLSAGQSLVTGVRYKVVY